MSVERRDILRAAGAAAVAGAAIAGRALAADALGPFVPPSGPRARVFYLNDLSGDIDGLFATVHAVLSPSIEVRGIVGTGPGQFDPAGENAASAARLVSEMLAKLELGSPIPVHVGSASRLKVARQPVRSPGVAALIAEALRTDTKLPLFVTVGGGLTEVASALMIEPAIARRFTLVWIGGGKPHPEGAPFEPNFGIDPLAAQFVFNDSKVSIWHVPSEVYQTCIVSSAELRAFVAPCGEIGRWLYEQVLARAELFKPAFNPGATWTLGDNPLVLLTALNDWVPSARETEQGPFTYHRTGSSEFVEESTPRLDPRGAAIAQPTGRRLRRYTSVDNRLMLNDFFALLRTNYPPAGAA